MSLYSLLLFVHVSGAICLFIGFGTWFLGITAIARAVRVEVVALGSLAIIGPIGTWVSDPKVRAIATLADILPDGPLPLTLAQRTHDCVLRTALYTTTAMLFGIVFLMITKPALISAIGAMALSAVLGLISSVGLARARRASASNRRKEEEVS